MKNIISSIQFAALILFIAATVWVAVSIPVFRFRHPWATETEGFLHLPDALMLRKISYDDMRHRD